jgi:hypothetical protein
VAYESAGELGVWDPWDWRAWHFSLMESGMRIIAYQSEGGNAFPSELAGSCDPTLVRKCKNRIPPMRLGWRVEKLWCLGFRANIVEEGARWPPRHSVKGKQALACFARLERSTELNSSRSPHYGSRRERRRRNSIEGKETMKKLLLATFCAVSLLGGTAQSQGEERWYLWHLGGETCVPLDDIAEDGHRLYYGVGDMRTPHDFENYLRRAGAIIKNIKVHPTYPSYRYYELRLDNNNDLTALLVNDLNACKIVMGTIDRAGLK